VTAQRRARGYWVMCLLTACLILIFLAGHFGLGAQEKAKSSRDFAFTGVRIYAAPDAKPLANGVVVVENGKIVSVGDAGKTRVPEDVKTIDCSGKTLVAGLWNSHVHFMEPKWNDAANLPADRLTSQMQEMLTSYGFTSVVDTGSILQNTLALRRRIGRGEVAGPRILTAGQIIFPENGLPFYLTENLPPDALKIIAEGEAATPEDAVRFVDKQIGEGADIVKLYAVTWLKRDGKIVTLPMKLSIIKAATEEAHRKGKLVFAHPSTLEGVRLVLAGHVDVLAHTSEEGWDSTTAAQLKAAHVTLIPTLTLFSHDNDFDAILKEVKSYQDVGGEIMFGTDIGYLTDYAALTQEYGYLAHAGLTFPQILATLTTNPARRMGFGDRTGKVQPGMDADLTVVDGDPAEDVNAFSKVALTMRQGRVIYQEKYQEKVN